MRRTPNKPKTKLSEQEVRANHSFTQGLKFHQQGKYREAIFFYDEAIAIKANYAEAYNNRGIALFELKYWKEALASYDQAISVNVNYSAAFNNRGNILFKLKRLDEALASYDQAISIKANYAEPYNNRGNVLFDLKRFDEALVSYDQAISIKRNYAEAYAAKANVYRELKRLDEALNFYKQAIEINPNYAEAYNNHGIVLYELRRLNEAHISFDKAIAIKPDLADAYNNRGNCLRELLNYQEAIINYDKAINIKSDYAEAYINRGLSFYKIQLYEEALVSFSNAIRIKPDSAEAYYNQGLTLDQLQHYDKSITSYSKAISIKSDYNYLLGNLLFAKLKLCDWNNFINSKDHLDQRIKANNKSATPFSILALSENPAIAMQCAQIFIQDKYPTNLTLGSPPKRARSKKIRLGYFSADFGNHAVSYLTAGLFEMHDHEQFEVLAFSLKSRKNDYFLDRIQNSFDQFIDVTNRSDQDIAQLSRELNIDIAIDLGGFTTGSRTGIFTYRAAPIQLSYIGYLGTMAAPYFDYLIADKTIIPPELQSHYTEQIIYLPSYQSNDRKRIVSEKIFTRQELGLPETGFVFACFNNSYKILPATFDGWMRILQKVNGSVLFIYADNHWVEENLKNEAHARGVDPQRLIFGKRIPLDQYMARYRSCDLFLDTTPYNAGTTASDALWVGLPVLTLIGKSFASRVAASLLKAIDLPELITNTQEQYEAQAIELALNPDKLTAMKHKLANNRLSTPLFDTPLFTKHLEAAYTKIMERYWADLPSVHIEID